MREGRPSFTAAAVAVARSVAGVDALALALVDGPLAAVARVGRTGWAGAAVVNVATLGLVDHIELRTRAIDAALREGVAAGLAQLVVLGAGLDARAWRMPELAGVRVFEVDHPSTQAFKRARVGDRAPEARDVRFVPVDFARDALSDALAAAGHDVQAPTFWVWEGVTMYLPPAAVRTTLASIAQRSARASRVAVTYATPRASPLGPLAVRVAHVGFRLLGEPILGPRTSGEMRAELGDAGFRVTDDLSATQWDDRYGDGRRRLLLMDEHLAVAVSDGPPRASRAG